jgi:hypothetical protein
MRQVLRLIGTRYGAALVLVLLIALVVGFGKLIGGGRHTGYYPGQGAAPDSTVAATDSPVPDDGEIEPSSAPPPPSMSPGAPSAQAVAVQFARAWLHHTGVASTQWTQGFAKLSTKSLQERLNGVDPAGVPANQITGDATVIDQDESAVDIGIPMDGGTLALRLLITDGRWLVDGVDWQRA